MAREYNPATNRNRISSERVRTLYGRTAGALAATCLAVTFGPDVLGSGGTQLSRAEQEAQLTSQAQEKFEEASIARKYEISFITPIREWSDQTHTDGHGIAGQLSGPFDSVIIRAGRSCLQDTAYDITAGGAPAALAVDGKDITIHATKTDAASLAFTIGESGTLEPSRQTADTLKAYNCRYLGGVPVRTSFPRGEDIEWDYKGSLTEQ